MVLSEPTPEDLDFHKDLSLRLIADGEYLLSLIRQVDWPENGDGITPDSLAATIELLRADYRGWHESMPSDRRKRILSEVFPDVA